MGDRCTVVVVCAKQHEGEVTAIMNGCVEPEFGANGTEHKDILELEFEEMNYGGYDQLQEIAAKGIPFHGWNGPGCSYGHGVFAAFEGKYAESPSGEDARPVVSVDQHGDINPGHMECALNYWRVRTSAEAAMAQLKKRKQRKATTRKSSSRKSKKNKKK